MQTRAQAKFVRVSARKARLVTDLIKGRDLAEAQQTLDYSEKGAARIVSKVLNSAAANAENNGGLNPDTLYVLNAYVDEGPTLKRFRPRAMGRATRINKRTSHITVILEEREPEKARPKRSFRRPMGKAARRKAVERAAAAEEAEKEAVEVEETEEEIIAEEVIKENVVLEEARVAKKLEQTEEEEGTPAEEPVEELGEGSSEKSSAEEAGTGEE